MSYLRTMQQEQKVWSQRNFPDNKIEDPLLGIFEEVGELAQAHLKHTQGIRKFKDKEYADKCKKDAIGDLVVYLMDYCNWHNFDLFDVISEVWNRVKTRDFQKDPIDGGREGTQLQDD